MMNTFELATLHRRDLSLARAYYFFYMGGWGFILPFINLFYVGLGLSGKQIGTLSATSSLVGLVLAPILVSEVKKRPNPERYLQWALALGALCYMFIGQQVSFWLILPIVFLQALVMSGLVPLSDVMAVNLAESAQAMAGCGSGFRLVGLSACFRQAGSSNAWGLPVVLAELRWALPLPAF